MTKGPRRQLSDSNFSIIKLKFADTNGLPPFGVDFPHCRDDSGKRTYALMHAVAWRHEAGSLKQQTAAKRERLI